MHQGVVRTFAFYPKNQKGVFQKEMSYQAWRLKAKEACRVGIGIFSLISYAQAAEHSMESNCPVGFATLFKKDKPQREYALSAKEEGALQLNIAGFPSDPEYSRKMMAAAVQEAALIDADSNRPLQFSLSSLAASRRFVAEDLKDLSKGSYISRKDAPVGLGDSIVTPIRAKYGFWQKAAMELEADPKFEPSRTYQIEGTKVRVTWIRKNAFHRPNGAIDFSYDWVHPDIGDVYAILDHAEKLYRSLLAFRGSKDETLKKIAELHWWIANAQPFFKGTASISDAFTKALLLHFQIPIRHWKPGIAPDIEAFHRSLDDYVSHYSSFFSLE